MQPSDCTQFTADTSRDASQSASFRPDSPRYTLSEAVSKAASRGAQWVVGYFNPLTGSHKPHIQGWQFRENNLHPAEVLDAFDDPTARVGLVDPEYYLGALLFDIDRGTPEAIDRFRRNHPGIAWAPSATPGRWHAWFLKLRGKLHRQNNDTETRPITPKGYSLGGDIRGAGSGVAWLHPGELEWLMEGLDRIEGVKPPSGARFPGRLFEGLRLDDPRNFPKAWAPKRRRRREGKGGQVRPNVHAGMTRAEWRRFDREAQKPLTAWNDPAVDCEPRDSDKAAVLHPGERHTGLFDLILGWCSRQYRGPGGRYTESGWAKTVTGYLAGLVTHLPTPLCEHPHKRRGRACVGSGCQACYSEVAKMAAGVAQWTWDNPRYGWRLEDGRDDSEVQSARARLRGPAVRAKNLERNQVIHRMHIEGADSEAIAQHVGLTGRHIRRLLAAWGTEGPEQPAMEGTRRSVIARVRRHQEQAQKGLIRSRTFANHPRRGSLRGQRVENPEMKKKKRENQDKTVGRSAPSAPVGRETRKGSNLTPFMPDIPRDTSPDVQRLWYKARDMRAIGYDDAAVRKVLEHEARKVGVDAARVHQILHGGGNDHGDGKIGMRSSLDHSGADGTGVPG